MPDESAVKNAVKAAEAYLRLKLGDEEFERQREYWRGIMLFGHGVVPGSYHQVNLRDGSVDMYLVGATCLHCSQVVE